MGTAGGSSSRGRVPPAVSHAAGASGRPRLRGATVGSASVATPREPSTAAEGSRSRLEKGESSPAGIGEEVVLRGPDRRARSRSGRLHLEGPAPHRRFPAALRGEQLTAQGHAVAVRDVHAELLHQPRRRLPGPSAAARPGEGQGRATEGLRARMNQRVPGIPGLAAASYTELGPSGVAWERSAG